MSGLEGVCLIIYSGTLIPSTPQEFILRNLVLFCSNRSATKCLRFLRLATYFFFKTADDNISTVDAEKNI